MAAPRGRDGGKRRTRLVQSALVHGRAVVRRRWHRLGVQLSECGDQVQTVCGDKDLSSLSEALCPVAGHRSGSGTCDAHRTWAGRDATISAEGVRDVAEMLGRVGELGQRGGLVG